MTGGVDLPLRAIREQISSAFDVLVQISRLVDGSRRVTHITEVLRMESDVITLQDLFVAKPPDEGNAASIRGSRLLAPLACTGLKPHFLEKMAANGVVLPPTFFRADVPDGGAGVLRRPVRRCPVRRTLLSSVALAAILIPGVAGAAGGVTDHRRGHERVSVRPRRPSSRLRPRRKAPGADRERQPVDRVRGEEPRPREERRPASSTGRSRCRARR